MRAAKPYTFSVREKARALVARVGETFRKRKMETVEEFHDGVGATKVKKRKQLKGLTREEKMKEVVREIVERGGLKRELLFRGEGKRDQCSLN